MTIIIGAGAAGLATAARLRQRGLPYRLIDAGDAVGASWGNRYDSLRLHTVRWLSALPGKPIPKAYGPWVRRDDLVRYLQDYAGELDLRPELGVRATRVEADGSGWRVETSAGPLTAEAVVVASGYSHTPYVPDWPGRDSYPGQVTHSSAYREPSPYAGKRVLVVGSGNSAGDLVTDLVGVAAEVIMAVRTPPNIIRRDTRGVPSQLLGIASDPLPAVIKNPMSGLLRKLTIPDLSGYGLAAPTKDGFSQFERSRTVPILDCGFIDAVTSGRVRFVPAVTGFEGGSVRLADGSQVEVDAVLAATGYRTGLPPLVGHLGVLDERGMPQVSGGRTLPQAPRLHFIGIKVELTGLLREIGIEAGRIARSLAGSA
ncbi:MAG TPA: NAD(P)/FAD-dependent oxidoreductase [Microlunatus sp.]|jgi:putative flavoprotein involved in K+ transport|nr:NAD(P)/FAD-dependent oxidoreductase [Microlunatus sp.]